MTNQSPSALVLRGNGLQREHLLSGATAIRFEVLKPGLEFVLNRDIVDALSPALNQVFALRGNASDQEIHPRDHGEDSVSDLYLHYLCELRDLCG